MARAVWNGVVLAESSNTKLVEGNHYFPLDSVKREYLHPSQYSTTCFWKGEASYYNIEINGAVNENAAWYYQDPSSAASVIKDHVAFWRGVKVEP